MIGNITKESNSNNVKRWVITLLPFYLFTFLLLSFAACTETVSDAKQETAQPSIYPDYIGVTIPVNIAPLNFSMADDNALLVDAVITDSHGHELHSQGDDAVDFVLLYQCEALSFCLRIEICDHHMSQITAVHETGCQLIRENSKKRMTQGGHQ